MRQLQIERIAKMKQRFTDPHTNRPYCPTPYAETWFQNMMARLSADQEMSEAHGLRESQGSYHDDVTWGMIQRQWTTTTQRDLTERDLRSSLQLTDDWFSNRATVASDDFTPYPSGSSRAPPFGGLNQRQSVDVGCQVYETELRESSDQRRLLAKCSRRARKRSLSASIITHMRCRVRKSVHKLSKMLRK
ncbi:hypothetical protein BO71DRAFT_399587 [Aspergillus ellipticus CBS 707.79]|uniref:Uncharacterized protein n=1 Tax=Aspergillus ellipticus CBS 707.79 TaxID=1448320 RepID=A0A319DHX1_9EURO|nr:hypothetical protein BO71DRAFT_399587 [Aspergillus ellipticus CBS 707.79]